MKSSNIGGQAVLEGVMMKNRDTYAVAVRKPDGEIEIKKDNYRSVKNQGSTSKKRCEDRRGGRTCCRTDPAEQEET